MLGMMAAPPCFAMLTLVLVVAGISLPTTAAQRCTQPLVVRHQDEAHLVNWALEQADDPCVLVYVDEITLNRPLSLSRNVNASLGPGMRNSHLTIRYTGSGNPISVAAGRLTFVGSVSMELPGNCFNTFNMQGSGESNTTITLGILLGISLLALVIIAPLWWESRHSRGQRLNQIALEATARQRISSVVDGTKLAPACDEHSAGDLNLLERLRASVRLDSCELHGEPWDLLRGSFVENFVPLLIKRANKQHAADKEAMEMLLLEAQLMTMLDTTYVAQFYGYFFTHRHGVSLLYAHSSGGTLRMALRRLKENAGLSVCVGSAIQCLHEVANAVQYLHSLDMVHGSLSADAVYVNTTLSRPRLAGFCPSSATVDDKQLFQPAHAPRIKWTAPECVAEGRLTAAGDIFSFAILCWEVFSEGALPFEGVPATQVYTKHLRGQRLSQPDVCPGDAYTVISRAWADDPSQRPTAAVLAEEWEKTLTRLVDRGQIERPRKDEDDGEDTPMPPTSSLRHAHGNNRPRGFMQRLSCRSRGYNLSAEEQGSAPPTSRRWTETYGLDIVGELQDNNYSSTPSVSLGATNMRSTSVTAQQLEGEGAPQAEMLASPSVLARTSQTFSDDESTASGEQSCVRDSFVLADEAEERERVAQNDDTEFDARAGMELEPEGYIEITSAEVHAAAAANDASSQQGSRPGKAVGREGARGEKEQHYQQLHSSSSSTGSAGNTTATGGGEDAGTTLAAVDKTTMGLPLPPTPQTNAWTAPHQEAPGGDVHGAVDWSEKSEHPQYEQFGTHNETGAVPVVEEAGIYEQVEAVGQRTLSARPLPPLPGHTDASGIPPPLPPKGTPRGMAPQQMPGAIGDEGKQQRVYEEPV